MGPLNTLILIKSLDIYNGSRDYYLTALRMVAACTPRIPVTDVNVLYLNSLNFFPAFGDMKDAWDSGSIKARSATFPPSELVVFTSAVANITPAVCCLLTVLACTSLL